MANCQEKELITHIPLGDNMVLWKVNDSGDAPIDELNNIPLLVQ